MIRGSVKVSSLHNLTKYVTQAALGYLEGGLLLFVLNVDAGSMFNQQLGSFYTLLITCQVAVKKTCMENCKYTNIL